MWNVLGWWNRHVNVDYPIVMISPIKDFNTVNPSAVENEALLARMHK